MICCLSIFRVVFFLYFYAAIVVPSCLLFFVHFCLLILREVCIVVDAFLRGELLSVD